MTRPNRFHPHNRQNQASHPLTTVSPPSVSLRNQAGKGGNENLGGEGARCSSFLGAWAVLTVLAAGKEGNEYLGGEGVRCPSFLGTWAVLTVLAAGKEGNEYLGGEGVRCPSFLGAWAALTVAAAGKEGNENLGGEGVRCPSFLGAWAALIVTAGPASDVTVIALVLAVASPRAVTVAAVGAVLSSSAYLCNRADKGDQTGKGGNINLGGGEWNVKLGGGDGE